MQILPFYQRENTAAFQRKRLMRFLFSFFDIPSSDRVSSYPRGYIELGRLVPNRAIFDIELPEEVNLILFRFCDSIIVVVI